jgi:hypothetical protein
VRAWGAGLYAAGEDNAETPEDSVLKDFMKSRLEQYSVEAALLERGGAPAHVAFTEVPESDLEAVLTTFR